jgi:hypothetical protein
MTTTTKTVTSQQPGFVNFATGSFTGDGNTINIPLGFKPRYVRAINETDAIVWEKFEGEAAANSVKTDTAVALSTSSDVLFNSDNSISFSATAAPSAKVVAWAAFG